MMDVLDFLRSDIASDLAISLLHSLWQGIVIAAGLFLLLRNTPGSRSELRYRLSVTALCIIVLGCLATFSILQYEPQAPDPAPTASALTKPIEPETIEQTPVGQAQPDNPAAAQSSEPAITITIPAQDSDAAGIGTAGWGMLLWTAGVCVMLGRMFWALAGAARLKRDAVDIEDPAMVELFRQLCQRMGIGRSIRFAASQTLAHPGVIGFWRPVLLVPVSILSEISVEDLQAILAHELAHIRRLDYLVNFCQMVIEAVLFFNPAVWWVSRRIRIEREACCDIAGVATTGHRIQYAKVLFDQFTKTAAGQPAMTAAITGFSNDNCDASEERIRRIIHPQHKPRMKIGWIKLTCWLMISGFVLLGLHKTTNVAIAMAVKILTPAERIEVMTELEKSHGLPAFDPDSNGDIAEEDKVALAGTVRTYDGKKVDPLAHITIHYARHQSSGSIGISPTFDPKAQNCTWNGDTGQFSHRNSFGTIFVSVSAPGYAPACVGPYQMDPGQVKDDIEIVLEKGYPASIQIIDAETQQPVPEVEMTGGYLFRPGGYHHTIHLTTDENGIAVIENAADFNVTLKAQAEGYQQTSFEDQILLKNEIIVLEMQKAESAEGIVLSESSGQPVAGAVIRIQQSMGKNSMSWGRDQAGILATTDDQGRFVLDQLNEETTYVFSVKADGYAYGFTDEISPGQKDIQIRLRDEIVIPGRVTGPLDKLPIRDGKPYVSYTCVFSWKNHSNAEISQQAFVSIEGDEGFFEVTDVWGTHVNIGSGYSRTTVKFDEPIPGEILLDLSDPLTDAGTPYHKRQLVLEFETPEGFPPPTGNIRLNYMDPNHSNTTYKGKLVDIVDGKAEAEIVAPGKIGYGLADTIGYWFKESSEIKVDDGTEPLVIQVPAIPAGMIFGQVYEEDGSPAGSTMVSYNMPEKSPLLGEDTHFLEVDGKNSSSDSESETKYSINPLPLGGVYRIIAHRKNTYAVSERIKLTEENPIWEMNLIFPQGITVSGQILLPDGSPAKGIEYWLNFDVTDGHSFSRQGEYTDSEGRFAFENINPDADGTYHLEIKCKKDYRPVRMKLERLNRPIEIQLEQGAVASGRIVDKETGWPIPNVEVSAWYSKYDEENPEYDRLEAEAKTDRDGRFRFSNMKPGREYHLTVSDCRQDDPGIIGDQTRDRIYEVTPYDWSQLKPRQPDAGF